MGWSITRILYIDERLSAPLSYAVEQLGHKLDTATTGREGLALHSSVPYDVLIVNSQLADMTGIALCRKLLRADSELAVIFVADATDQMVVSEALDLGVSQYLVKDDQSKYLGLLPGIVKSLLPKAKITQEMRIAIDLKRINQEREKEFSEFGGLFYTLVEKAPIGIFYAGSDGVLLYVNEALATTTGYPIENLIGKLWMPKIHPDDRDAVTDHWLANVDQFEPWYAEFRFQKPDGTVSWVTARTTSQIGEDGKIIGHVGTVTDITKLKQIEAERVKGREELKRRVVERTRELTESMEIQNAILANIAEGVSLANADGRIVAYNQQFLNINDFPAELLENGANFEDLTLLNAKRGYYGPGDPIQLTRERLEQLNSPEATYSEKVHPDGRIVEIRRQPLADGGVVITDIDITERRKFEEDLRRQQIIIEKVEQAAHFGHWTWDEENDVCLVCSEGLAELIGMTVDEFMDRTSQPGVHRHPIHPDDAARVEQAGNRMLATGEQYSVDYRFVHPDGEIRWVREVGSPVEVSDSGDVLISAGITYDITEAREIEDRLRHSEERYRQIADVSSDWVWEMDADLRFSYFSEGFERITGIDPAFPLGKTRTEVALSEDLEKPNWRNHLADLEAHREFRGFQYAFVIPNGEHRYFQLNGTPVYNQNNEFAGYRGTASDVTKRVSTQQELADSTAKLRHAVALARLGHYVWDGVNKLVISCTEECARIHGVSVDEYISTTDSLDALLSWIHPADRDYYLQEIERAVAECTDLQLQYRIVARDGRIRHVHEVFDPSYNAEGKLIQTIGALQDITERKEVEAALIDAERLAALGNWSWSVDNNQILSYSEGFARVLGIAFDDVPELMAQPGMGTIHIDDRKRHAKVFNLAMEQGLDYEIEYRTVRPDGEIRDLQEIAEAIYDTAGVCRELKGTIQDITERKNIERELDDAKKEAEKANHAKSGFLSSMSHELRTPLNAILGFSQILEADQNQPLTEKQRKAVAHINKGGRHLLDLITQILDFARVETGQTQLSMTSVSLDIMIPECLSIANALAESQKIEIVDRISGKGLPHIYADLIRLKQVLLNLLSNGVKYNREGGKLIVDAEVTEEQVMRISIIDTGFGIDEKLHRQVFEAFDRLGRESLDVEGTGIGLTISKQLVELMNGQIGFHSEINSGSTFWIELPLADIECQTEVMDTSDHDIEKFNGPIISRERIYQVLYVEDNLTNTQLMTGILEGLDNVELTSVIDAESGLKLARAEVPDLILMDIQLPGMDGIEALTRLKRSDKTRKIPVIAVSAAAMETDINRARDVGFYGYLTKPLNIGKTLETIRGALQDCHTDV